MKSLASSNIVPLNCITQLPGHKGTVTAVDFHPKEPIGKKQYTIMRNSLKLISFLVLTGSKDGTMLVGEIEPSLSV